MFSIFLVTILEILFSNCDMLNLFSRIPISNSIKSLFKLIFFGLSISIFIPFSIDVSIAFLTRSILLNLLTIFS